AGTEALGRERGWDLVEVDGSDKRSGDILAKVAGLASTQSTLFSKGRLILLDEVDGINLRADQGAVATILQIIKETQYPLILTANDPWDPKTRPLREACLQIELKRLGVRDGLPLLRNILNQEGVKANDDALRLILDRDRGDIRSILNDMQLLSSRHRSLTVDDIDLLSGRDRTESIFEVLRIISTAGLRHPQDEPSQSRMLTRKCCFSGSSRMHPIRFRSRKSWRKPCLLSPNLIYTSAGLRRPSPGISCRTPLT